MIHVDPYAMGDGWSGVFTGDEDGYAPRAAEALAMVMNRILSKAGADEEASAGPGRVPNEWVDFSNSAFEAFCSGEGVIALEDLDALVIEAKDVVTGLAAEDAQ